MRRFAATINLAADAAKIEEYLAHHRAVWPEVVLSFRAVGVRDLRIWRLETRMFYELEVEDGFDPARDFSRYAAMHPSNPVWEAFMTSFQVPLAGRKEGENWASMECAFSLDDQVRALTSGEGLRIDSHLHLWEYSKEHYGWIDEKDPVLATDRRAIEAQPLLSGRSIHGAVVVQANFSDYDNDFLLGVAEKHRFILGIVGWIDPTSAGIDAFLDKRAGDKRLVGFRELIQSRPESEWLNDAFIRGVRRIGERGYAYDILANAPQLAGIRKFVAALDPAQRLVLDHLGKPDIRGGELREWATNMRALAKDHPNLHCKLSGMVTEAPPGWTASDLRPYMETVLEAFGPSRVLYGSDWPVCLLNAKDYGTVHDVAADYVRTLGKETEAAVFGGNATRFYKLAPPSL